MFQSVCFNYKYFQTFMWWFIDLFNSIKWRFYLVNCRRFSNKLNWLFWHKICNHKYDSLSLVYVKKWESSVGLNYFYSTTTLDFYRLKLIMKKLKPLSFFRYSTSLRFLSLLLLRSTFINLLKFILLFLKIISKFSKISLRLKEHFFY